MMEACSLSDWVSSIKQKTDEAFKSNRWGDLPNWLGAVNRLPEINPSSMDLKSDVIRIGEKNDCNDEQRREIEEIMMRLHPWRKGPFELFGVMIETEWRSDYKWNRLQNHISSLKGRSVLDIGCGSGYHIYRMLGEGAQCAVGIDPTMLYVIQFYAFQKYIQNPAASVLPIGIDDVPMDIACFDSVFSMGLLYHRRSPLDHLMQCHSFLREGGELIMETLVIDGKEGEILNPKGRYAKMPNVWFIPSPATLENWLNRMDFQNVELIDVTKTTSEEQRVTKWMGFESLADFLDPDDQEKTIEGYPAPKRAIFKARKA